MLDAGLYGIWVGNSSRNVTLAGVLQIPERVLLEETEHICPLQEELNELNAPSELRKEQEKAWHTVMKEKQHTANSKELCIQAVRNEWGFKGIIMTDWTTTMPNGGSLSWKCVEAGNDLIMPGYDGDFESIRGALASGELSMEDLKACVARMLTVIFQTNAYENAGCYGTQFGFQE